LRKKFQQVDHVVLAELFFESLRHERLLGFVQLVNVFALDSVSFAFGIQNLHGGPRFRRQKAGDDLARGGRHRILAVIPLDASAGIHDLDQQMIFGVDCHAGEVGTDFSAFVAVRVTFRAMILEDNLAAGRVAFGLGQRHELIHDFLAIGVRNAARLGEQLPGAGRDRPPRIRQ